MTGQNCHRLNMEHTDYEARLILRTQESQNGVVCLYCPAEQKSYLSLRYKDNIKFLQTAAQALFFSAQGALDGLFFIPNLCPTLFGCSKRSHYLVSGEIKVTMTALKLT